MSIYTTVTWDWTLPAGCRGESCRTSSGSRKSSGGSCERGCCDSSPESPAVGHRCSIRRRKSVPPCTAVTRVLPASALAWWGSCWTPSPGPSRGTCTPGSSASAITEEGMDEQRNIGWEESASRFVFRPRCVPSARRQMSASWGPRPSPGTACTGWGKPTVSRHPRNPRNSFQRCPYECTFG